MAGLAAVTLEGVLRQHVGAAPIPEGFNLYQALSSMYRVAVVLDDHDTAEAALWLRKEGLRDYVLLQPSRPQENRVVQLARLRALGPVELVIDPDPAVVAGALQMGLTAMLFSHPRATRPEWRPDYEKTPRAWDQLVAQVEQTRLVES